MTKEQQEACKALAKKFVKTDAAYEGAEQRVWECGVEYGFQAAQTPEMVKLMSAEQLLGHPLVKGLVEALGHYAKKSNWRFTCGDEISDHYENMPNDNDHSGNGTRGYYSGARARKALAPFKEVEK